METLVNSKEMRKPFIFLCLFNFSESVRWKKTNSAGQKKKPSQVKWWPVKRICIPTQPERAHLHSDECAPPARAKPKQRDDVETTLAEVGEASGGRKTRRSGCSGCGGGGSEPWITDERETTRRERIYCNAAVLLFCFFFLLTQWTCRKKAALFLLFFL